MSDKIDVLAVMTAEIESILRAGGSLPIDLMAAREAVAKLIEAAKMARYSGCVNYLIPSLVELGQAHPSDVAKYTPRVSAAS